MSKWSGKFRSDWSGEQSGPPPEGHPNVPVESNRRLIFTRVLVLLKAPQGSCTQCKLISPITGEKLLRSLPLPRLLPLPLYPVDFHSKVIFVLHQHTWTQFCNMQGTAVDMYRDIESNKLDLILCHQNKAFDVQLISPSYVVNWAKWRCKFHAWVALNNNNEKHSNSAR